MQDFSRMTDSTDFRELLLAYLLDELPANERERVDQQMLVDDDYSTALKEAEYDLLDSYAAAELTSEQRDRVYMALIAQNASGARSRESQILPHDSAESVSVGMTAASTLKMRPKRALRWVWIGLAAALTLAAGLTASLEYRTRQRYEGHGGREAARGSGQAKPADHATVAAGTSQTAVQAKQADPASPPVRPLLDAAALTLVLPETTRGSSGLTAKLLPETRFLRVEWPGASALSSADRDSLRLQVADEQRILTIVPSARRAKSAHGSAVFQVPVKSLMPGSYLFRVVGAADAHRAETLQVYAENAIAVTR